MPVRFFADAFVALARTHEIVYMEATETPAFVPSTPSELKLRE